MALHPVLAASADAVVREASWDSDAAIFSVPGRTTAVFVAPEGTEPVVAPEPTPEMTAAPTVAPPPTAEATAEAVAAAPPEEPTAAPTEAPTATAVAAEEPAPTAEEGAAAETTPTEPAGRQGVTALALLIVVGAAGAVAGLVAWLRGRGREE